MSSDNWFGIEPPRDANGKVIPLDTETLYDTGGQIFHAVAFRYSLKERVWFVHGSFTGPKDGLRFETNRLLLAPPDSWEKLEEDAKEKRRNMASSFRHDAAYGEGSLSEWWGMLQFIVLDEDDFPNPRQVFRSLADLIDPEGGSDGD